MILSIKELFVILLEIIIAAWGCISMPFLWYMVLLVLLLHSFTDARGLYVYDGVTIVGIVVEMIILTVKILVYRSNYDVNYNMGYVFLQLGVCVVVIIIMWFAGAYSEADGKVLVFIAIQAAISGLEVYPFMFVTFMCAVILFGFRMMAVSVVKKKLQIKGPFVPYIMIGMLMAYCYSC